MAVLLLLHTPPDAVLLSAIVAPMHADDEPVIAGTDPTVTVVVIVQPVPTRNVIVAVPAVRPLTTPVLDTVATDVLLLLHDTPLVAALLSVVVDPRHTNVEPVIAGGVGLTVTTFVREQPVPIV